MQKRPGATRNTATATTLINEHSNVIKALNRKLLSVLHIDNDMLVDAALNYGSVDKGSTSIITLTGSLDISVTSELHQLLLGYLSRKQNLIIYMSDVRHVDSAGAATLLDIYAIARGVALGFALVAINRNVLHTFSLCCLGGVSPLFEHIGDAKKHLQELLGT